MIHSLAGGEIGKPSFDDYAKVELLPPYQGVYWYKNDIYGLNVGDNVLIPFGKNSSLIKAKVLRIDRLVSSQNSPIPSKKAKYIYQKIN